MEQKKEIEYQPVFCCNGGTAAERKKVINAVKNLIKKHSTRKIVVDYFDDDDMAVITVPEHKYQSSLRIVRDLGEICGINQLSEANVYWIGTQGCLYPLSFITVMYGVLPITSDEDTELNENTDDNINSYFTALEEFLVNRTIYAKFYPENNTITILIEGSSEEYPLLKKQCQGFNYVYQNNPFIEMAFLEDDETLNKDTEIVINNQYEEIPKPKQKLRKKESQID